MTAMPLATVSTPTRRRLVPFRVVAGLVAAMMLLGQLPHTPPSRT